MSILVVENLVKTYPGSRKTPPVEAVRGVSFTVERGEFFGLLGPNGAGKSTTIGCISSLVRPTSGRILVDGVDVARAPQEAKRRIAVVPQARNLDRDLSVREVLTYHGRYFGLAGRRARGAGRPAARGAADRGQGGREAAHALGGQQQRVMIARALMHDPKVVLLDEPTTGLDPQARRLLWEALRGLHERGTTFILTTHYMDEADRLCQRLAIVDHGKILTLDTPAALKKSLPGAQVLDLWMRAPRPLAPRLREVPGVLNLEPVEAGGEDGVERLRLFVDPADGLLDRVLHAVRDGGADLHHVNLAQPSLEDVYIHLTGRGLRE